MYILKSFPDVAQNWRSALPVYFAVILRVDKLKQHEFIPDIILQTRFKNITLLKRNPGYEVQTEMIYEHCMKETSVALGAFSSGG